MVTRKNDDAVSPVIGVILMVAITVILAAVIAAFVFGMSGNITKTKTVAITAQKLNAGNISVMNMGGQDGGTLTTMVVTTTPVSTAQCTATPTGLTVTGAAGAPCTIVSATAGGILPVGTNVMMVGTGYTARTQVTVVGTFTDGTNQVLLDTFL
jgi:flagellin-like protein